MEDKGTKVKQGGTRNGVSNNIREQRVMVT